VAERDELLRLEKQLARIGGPISAQDTALIADDFVEFGASGRVWTKTEIVAAMADWHPIRRTIDQFVVRDLAPSVRLVTYRLVEEEGGASSLRSSLWRRTGEGWQMFFHQGTPSK